MVDTEVRTTLAEKISLLMDAEVEVSSQKWQLQKKRKVVAHNLRNGRASVFMDLSVLFSSFTSEGQAVNRAEIFLLPEELPIFTSALMQHQILFPISFSQQLTLENGLYCIRLKSEEAPEDFATRLSDSLRTLEV